MLGQKDGDSAASLGSLLAPAALGGLVAALLTGETARKWAGNALIVGGGAALGAVVWNKYKDRIKETYSRIPGIGSGETAPQERAARLVRALVFAAKCDGHIDPNEQQAIQTQLQQLSLGTETERLVQEAMSMPLDPNIIAAGVANEQEALEVYVVSCAAINIDHFMERSYLDALALALKLPEDVKKGIEADIHAKAAV